ncbi:host attachment protein [Bosea psychrotolerans]|uniref:Protein required for attachment to host cells n=1 Tax=Bosea psychrotolerans TaxID=1871628 RepID=A0A2S4LXD4_9HYPH|nr:host attachment protein [Bosea psychrotolerans]POR47122.1 protein required for attachment to host cells [Bosea psychrotolerans]
MPHTLEIKIMNLRIPHDGWVIVCDARKAIFLRNEGDAAFPNLKVEQVNEAPANPSNVEQGADRPGRVQNAIAPTSAIDAPDWHELAEAHFARDTIEAIEALHRTRRPPGFVLVAPPRMLAALRENLDGELRSSIIAEIHKDLTKHPVHEIERLLCSA